MLDKSPAVDASVHAWSESGGKLRARQRGKGCRKTYGPMHPSPRVRALPSQPKVKPPELNAAARGVREPALSRRLVRNHMSLRLLSAS